MTFTVFVSISLLALVVTARPFPLADPESGDGQNDTRLNSIGSEMNGVATRSLREAVQAVFQSRTGYPLPGLLSSVSDTDIRVHLTSPTVVTSHLAALEGLDAVKAVLPLPFSALSGEAGQGTGADGAELSELTEEEKQLYELLRNSSAAHGSLEDVDGGVRPVPELEPLTAQSPGSKGAFDADGKFQQSPTSKSPAGHFAMPTPTPTSPALLVLVVSALASLLVVACISLSMYSVSYFRTHVLRSDITWDIVPRIEKGTDLRMQDADTAHSDGNSSEGGQEDPDIATTVVEKDLIDFEGPITAAARHVLVDEKTLPLEHDEKIGLVDGEKSDTRTTEDRCSDELNEKSAFYDVRDSPLLFASDTLPHALHIVVEEHPDPDLLPLPSDTSSPATSSCVTPLQRSSRVEPLAVPPSLKRLPSQTQMRERDTCSPVSKPAWSLRAAESPALGLPASSAHTLTTSPLPFSSPAHTRTPSPTTMMPGTLFTEAEVEQEMREMRPGRARAYRAPMPELDIAFALQLRPGLGLGAEGAWLVRFLMAMFGWLGVVVGGGGPARGEQRRVFMA